MKESLLEESTTRASQPHYIQSIEHHHLQFLKLLQEALQQRYDITVPYCISEFVCLNEAHLKQITGHKVKYDSTSEMLIYQQNGDNLDITLYLDTELLKNIEDAQLPKHWAGKTFNSNCILLEGVSHFLYLVWNAHYDRQLSQLDLELQAEVDKFIFAALDARHRDSTSNLLKRLFQEVHYRSTMTPTLKSRYKKANELAHCYCTWLNNEFNLRTPNRQLAAELARFYRLNGAAKQRHITAHLH